MALFQPTHTDKKTGKRKLTGERVLGLARAGTETQSNSEGAAMPAPRMRFHPLAPEAKCPACGASLTFVRVRGYGDLYSCASGGPCKCPVIHYRSKVTKTCGFALIYNSGAFGKWTACAGTPAKVRYTENGQQPSVMT